MYASLPERFKSKIEEKHNPYKEVKTIVFEDYIKSDYEAQRFFEQYLLEDEDGTEHLPAERIREYSDNAKILNACHFIATNVVVQRKFGGRKEMWQKMAEIIQQLPSKEYKHKLPSNYRDLKAKTMAFKGIKTCKRYPTKGYEGLIHSGFMNKVAAKLVGVSAEWTLARWCNQVNVCVNSHNTKYDGHERVSIHGYIEVRVSLGKYVLKHRKIWQEHYGEIPKGSIIIFKDGNPLNCVIENLELISREENVIRNNCCANYPREIQRAEYARIKLRTKIREYGKK